MKTHLVLLLLFAHSANAFIPVVVNRGTQLFSSRRDEIAREIEEEIGPVHVTTHDENPWKEVLAGDHQNRKHLLKQKLATIKKENKELDKQVNALEHKLETLFAVTEVLYINEEELQHEVKDLKAEPPKDGWQDHCSLWQEALVACQCYPSPRWTQKVQYERRQQVESLRAVSIEGMSYLYYIRI